MNTVQTILRLDDVRRATGLSRSMIYVLIERGELPRPVKLGERASGWLESEILAWQQRRIAARNVANSEVA